jgi:hypothetical protein
MKLKVSTIVGNCINPNVFQVLQKSNGGFQKYSNLNKGVSNFDLYFPI